jgi:hypothetical protein
MRYASSPETKRKDGILSGHSTQPSHLAFIVPIRHHENSRDWSQECKTLLGDHRLHNRYPVGQRREAAGNFVVDDLSVDISMTDVFLTNLSQIITPSQLGFESSGIGTGNCGIFWR